MVGYGSASLGEAILVVDDEEAVLEVAARMLQRIGYRVITAGDGQTGIARFQEHARQIVCVLLDMTMPHVSGEAVGRAILAIDPGARIVMMSGYAEDDTLGRLSDLKLAGFLQKPFNLEMMRTTIGRVLGAASNSDSDRRA
jgi:two-component system, cell cycle sensor histidine kinase and response regulator CckA